MEDLWLSVRILMVSIALVLLALPLSANASAITKSTGGLLAVGSVFTATSTNETVETPYGTLKCGQQILSYKLTANGGETFEGAGNGAGSAKECSLGGKAVTKTDVTGLGLYGSPGHRWISFTYQVDYVFGVCHYLGYQLPFTYSSGSNIIHVSGTLDVDPPICAVGGGSNATADYALYYNGAPLKLD